MTSLFLAALGGGCGAVLRYSATMAIGRRWNTRIPLATGVVNISGSLLMGLLIGVAASWGIESWVVTILGAGVLGGFTTFSTASVETVRLLVPGAGMRPTAAGAIQALAYGGGTWCASWGAAGLGLWLGQA